MDAANDIMNGNLSSARDRIRSASDPAFESLWTVFCLQSEFGVPWDRAVAKVMNLLSAT